MPYFCGIENGFCIIMSYGIADLSITPMRRERSERSEMVSQMLFGEVYEVLETDEKWLYIRLLHDNCEGWVEKKVFREAHYGRHLLRAESAPGDTVRTIGLPTS